MVFDPQNSRWRIAISLSVIVVLSVLATGGSVALLVEGGGQTQSTVSSGAVDGSDVSIRQVATGTTTSDRRSSTQTFAIVPDTNLTLDNGTNYRFRLINDDTGESVTVALNASVTVETGQMMEFKMYDGTGTVISPPVTRIDGAVLPLEVIDGPVPSVANGTTNFSVALLNASGAELARTDSKPSVVGYSGVVEQNSTTGEVRISVSRDVVAPSTEVSLTLWPASAGRSPGNDSTDLSPSYNASTDRFETVVDAAAFGDGDYAWELLFSVDGNRSLQLKDDWRESGEITFGEQSEDDITIQQGTGATTSNGRVTTKQVNILSDTDLTFESGASYRLRLTNDDTGESVTLVVNGSTTVPSRRSIALNLYEATGETMRNPAVSVPGGVFPLDVVDGTVPAVANGTTNFSVALLNASGAELARTDSKPSAVGYSGVVEQNDTSGQVRVSIPRDVLPESTNASLTIWPSHLGRFSGGAQEIEVPMSYDDGTDEFAATLDATAFESTDYAWRVSVTSGGFELLGFDSTFIESGNLTLGAGGGLDGVAAQYDTDGNGSIDISELGVAAADYARGALSITELGELAAIYARS